MYPDLIMAAQEVRTKFLGPDPADVLAMLIFIPNISQAVLLKLVAYTRRVNLT